MAIVGGCVGTSLIGVFTTWREVRECLPGDSDEVLSSSDRDYTIVIRQIEKVIMGVLALYSWLLLVNMDCRSLHLICRKIIIFRFMYRDWIPLPSLN